MDLPPSPETSRGRSRRTVVPLIVWTVGIVVVVAFWVGVVKLVAYVFG